MEHRLLQRQKQIDLGKSTPAYAAYVSLVPLTARDDGRREDGHPVTPRKDRDCSKRGWDGLVRKWRRALHEWDVGGARWKECTEQGASVANTEDGQQGIAQRARKEEAGGEGDEQEDEEDELEKDEDEADDEEATMRESILRMAVELAD